MRRLTMVLLPMVLLALLLAACPAAAPAEPAAAPTEAPAAEAPAASEAMTETETMTETAAVTDTAAMTDSAPMAEVTLPEVNPLEVTGDIITAGSSTVFPLTEAMANRFIDEGYAGNITIDSVGTGAGFERFCVSGETDISNASRAIKEEEIASCAAIGREPIEFRVGTDALGRGDQSLRIPGSLI